MKCFLFLPPLILFTSFFANADFSDCQKMLNCSRINMGVISSNIANINTTRTPEGGPYQRQEIDCSDTTFKIIKRQSFLLKFEPGHVDADEHGYVEYPDIELMDEISNLIKVTRDYEEIVANCH